MIDSHPFRSMSMSPPISEIRLFQILTLKFQGQGHGCGQRARSLSLPSIYLICFYFISHQSDKNSWDTTISKSDLEKSKVKVMGGVKGRDHIVYPVSNQCTSFSFHINRKSHNESTVQVWGQSPEQFVNVQKLLDQPEARVHFRDIMSSWSG